MSKFLYMPINSLLKKTFFGVGVKAAREIRKLKITESSRIFQHQLIKKGQKFGEDKSNK